MALPAGVTKVTNIKGDKGNTGSLAFTTAETIPWTEGPDVQMVGPEENRGAHFKIPIPIPGPELTAMRDQTVEARDQAEVFAAGTVELQDEAIAQAIGTEGSEAREQVNATIAAARPAQAPRVRVVGSAPILTFAQQSSSTMYSPQIFDRSPMGGSDIGIIYSSDHEGVHANSGVFLVTTPDLLSPTWTDHGRIFRDDTGGTQTETPSAPWFDEASGNWVFTYQQNDVPTGQQSTLIAKSATPLVDSSWVKHGIVMQKQPGIGGTVEVGSGHSGYAYFPFLWGGERFARSLYGGWLFTQMMLWRQPPSALDPWEPVRIFKTHIQMTRPWGGAADTPESASGTDRMTRGMTFGLGMTFVFGGAPWWLGTIGAAAPGAEIAMQRIITAPLLPDLVTFAATPIDITPASGLDNLATITGMATIGGRTYVIAHTNAPQGQFWLLEVF